MERRKVKREERSYIEGKRGELNKRKGLAISRESWKDARELNERKGKAIYRES